MFSIRRWCGASPTVSFVVPNLRDDMHNGTCELDDDFGFHIINFISEMKPYWKDRVYPGKPYQHDQFRRYFSDHHPVFFRLTIPDEDDD